MTKLVLLARSLLKLPPTVGFDIVNAAEVAGETEPASVFDSLCTLKLSDVEVAAGAGIGELPERVPAQELIANKKITRPNPYRFRATRAYRELYFKIK